MELFKQKKEKLLEKAKRLKAFAEEFKDENITATLEEFIKEIQKDLTFNILCLGDFSSGKTTFINNFFIGKEVLPTKVTPTTAKLTILKYGDEFKIRVHYKNGSFRDLKGEEVKEELNNILTKDGKEVDKVDKVEVFINSEILKGGIEVVDSPGLNDPEIERMKVTLKYIDQADSVLYLLTAQQAWKGSEKEFLEEKIFRKEDLDKIFFLLNFWDVIGEEERGELLEHVKEQMKKSLKKVEAELNVKIEFPPLIPISAKTGENFDLLREKLWTYLDEKKEKDGIFKQKQKKLEIIKDKLKQFLNYKLELYTKENKELEENLSKIKEELESLKQEIERFHEEIKEKVEEVLDEFFREMEDIIEEVKESCTQRIVKRASKIKDIEKLNQILTKTWTIELFKKKRNFERLCDSYYKKVREIVESEKAKLDLDKMFLKKEFVNAKDLKSLPHTIEEDDSGFLTDILITGGSVGISIALAAINPFLGLIGLVGIGAGLVYKNKEEKEKISQIIYNIEEILEEFVTERINKLNEKREDVLNCIIEHIRSELVEAYKEKQKLYEKILHDKKIKEDTKEINFLRQKLEELEKI